MSLPGRPSRQSSQTRCCVSRRRSRRAAARFRGRLGGGGGSGRTTTYRYLQSEAFPERKGRSDAGRSSVDPWGEWVIARWNEGQRNGKPMLRERGFAGNYATVCATSTGYARRSPAARGPGPDRRSWRRQSGY